VRVSRIVGGALAEPLHSNGADGSPSSGAPGNTRPRPLAATWSGELGSDEIAAEVSEAVVAASGARRLGCRRPRRANSDGKPSEPRSLRMWLPRVAGGLLA
jgi:hypothetical protein